MKRKERLPELLAPAGSYEAMLAAVKGGADAVYLGGKAFGARAFADNFDLAALSETVRYCHLYGVRVYVTVNTLLYDRELSAALDFCRDLSDIGADAVYLGGKALGARAVADHFDLAALSETVRYCHLYGGRVGRRHRDYRSARRPWTKTDTARNSRRRVRRAGKSPPRHDTVR